MTQIQVLDAVRDRAGGYKVDVNRGERIGRVSSEWFSRPADERYLSLSDLFAAVRGRTERSRTRTVESAAIRAEANREDAERLTLILPGSETPIVPTHWSSHGRRLVNGLVHHISNVGRITGLSPLHSPMPIDTRPNSHPVAARGSRTTILHSPGEGSDGRDPSSDRLARPNSNTVRPPAPPELIRLRKIAEKSSALSYGITARGRPR